MSLPSDTARFREVLGHYPTGVCMITSLDQDDRPCGLLVGSFTSVSLAPALVGFFPDKGSSSWPAVEKSGRFCVNVLANGQQELCRQLSRSGAEKFSGVDFSASPAGLPVLAGAIAWIDCELHSVTEAGDHWFVLGEVGNLDILDPGDPMLFFRGKYGGFSGSL